MAIINNDVTYQSLIQSAATYIHNIIGTSSVAAGTFKNSSSDITIGTGHTWHPDHSGEGGPSAGQSSATSKTITETEQRAAYTPPTQATIVSNITTFMSNLGIPTTGTVNNSGLISFFFALNYFVEKAVIKRAITAGNEYHFHYENPSSSGYSKLAYSSTNDESVTSSKITDLYNQLSGTNMLSTNARAIGLSSSAHTSSSSSSSSSSSCSSSSFIIYFNLV